MRLVILEIISITRLLLAPSHKTFTWGADGHRLNCALAKEQLSPVNMLNLENASQMLTSSDPNR